MLNETKSFQMKNLLLFSIAFISSIAAFSQNFCLPAIGGELASDEPPGCTFCSNIYQGSTEGFTADTIVQNFSCGTIENNQWLSVQADFSGELELRIETKNCDNQEGIEVALFDQNLNMVECASIRDLMDWQITDLIRGEIYWLMIDGQNGDICDFVITRILQRGFINWKTTNAGRRQVCPGAEVCFRASLEFPALQYEWKIDSSGLTILSGGGLRDSFLCVRFDSLGTQTIAVNPIGSCFVNYSTGNNYEVVDAPVFSLKRTYNLCLPDIPFSEFGQRIDSFGLTKFTYKTAAGCDSVYEFRVNRFRVNTSAGSEFCQGDTVIVNNQVLTEGGTYNFLYEFGNQNQCDSLFSYNLTQIDTAAPEINCLIDTFVRGVGISWDRNLFIKEYKLRINNQLIILDNQSSYLYLPKVKNEQLNISLEPSSDRCFHHIAYAQCIGPDKVTSAKEINETQLYIFPNPSEGIFKIQSDEKISLIEVFDFSGRQILKTKNQEIDLSAQKSGVYFFKIRTNQEIFIKKVVKI